MIGFQVKRKSNTTDMSPRTKANLPGPTRHWFIKMLRAQISADLKVYFRLDIDKTADSKQHFICWRNMEDISDKKKGKKGSKGEKNAKNKKRNRSTSSPTYPNKRNNRQSTRFPPGLSVCSTFFSFLSIHNQHFSLS